MPLCRAILLLPILVSLTSVGDADGSPRELVFLNWPDYMDPSLIEDFKRQYRVDFKEVYFEDDDHRTQLLVESDGKGYDLAIVDGVNIAHYQKKGWLAAISNADIPNLKHINQRWRNAYPGTKTVGVPYFWGAVGIAYREDLVGEPVTRWAQLFNPSGELKHKITMMQNSRELVGAALLAAGHSLNSIEIHALNQAKRILLAQRPFVKNYRYTELDESAPLVTGEALVAMIYSGDALMLGQYNANIKYQFPLEGGMLWADYIVVLNSSPNKDLAETFIDFINKPKNAAKLAEFVYYPSPNVAAKKYLSKEYLNNPVINPDRAILDGSEFILDLPPRFASKYTAIAVNVTQ